MTGKSAFRFAPNPNGRLHLGHALSALLNQKMAKAQNGRLLLRIENIDGNKLAPKWEKLIIEDLQWLGFEWEQPVRRQSEHFSDYRTALTKLADAGLVYPAFRSNSDIRSLYSTARQNDEPWNLDPDGVPLYPTDERDMSEKKQMELIAAGAPYVWRLNMDKALEACGKELSWQETGIGPKQETGKVVANPALWGDVAIAHDHTPTTYHLSVVVDDALQGITNVVRGQDLFYATALHRLLQSLLQLPEPAYHHHPLITDENGEKLSKSRNSPPLADLKQQGKTLADIQEMLALN